MRTLCMISVVLFATLAAGETPEERAARVHAEAFVLDTHADTTPKFENGSWDFTKRQDSGHVDLPRLREGGFDAVFWSIYMGKTPGEGRAVKRAVKRMDAVHELVRKHPEHLILATTAQDVRDAAAQNKIACLMGIEGGHIIENDLAALRTLHRLGARYMTLTHSFNTPWADSAGTTEPVEPEHDGLTNFGREIVLEMNRLGMMVDVSHVADSTFWDVIEVTQAPVIASHSSARALADHARNMTDDMLRAVAENGGVVQVNFYPGYIDPVRVERARGLLPDLRKISRKYADDPERAADARRELFAKSQSREQVETPATVVIEQIEHIIKVAGPDHVGLGADWDGVPDMPEGLEDVSKVPWITAELLRRGHDEDTVKKALGGNLLRVMEAVEKVSVELNASR